MNFATRREGNRSLVAAVDEHLRYRPDFPTYLQNFLRHWQATVRFYSSRSTTA